MFDGPPHSFNDAIATARSEPRPRRSGSKLPAYLGCCGSWLPGQAGAVSRSRNQYGSRNSKPEQVLIAMKAHCSRALNRYAFDTPDRRRWARHGSTRYLWTQDAVRAAVQYVVHEQGPPMAVFETPLAGAQGSVVRPELKPVATRPSSPPTTAGLHSAREASE